MDEYRDRGSLREIVGDLADKIRNLSSNLSSETKLKNWIENSLGGLEALFEMSDLNAEQQDDFNPEFTHNVIHPALETVFHHWFRGEVIGHHHLPQHGGGLIVANHAGVLPVDALMLLSVVYQHARRDLRMLSGDLVFQFPGVNLMARKTGSVIGRVERACDLLDQDHLVGVFPEGYKGLGKPYAERYQLQRFGRGGFIAVALRTQKPIIPCAIVGSEEIYPMIADIKPLAQLLTLPYFPVTPFFPFAGPLGMLPLPSKWVIVFGPPIHTDHYDPSSADDPAILFELADQVRDIIQQMLYQVLRQRTNIFLG